MPQSTAQIVVMMSCVHDLGTHMTKVFVKRNKDAFAVLAREFAKKCKSLGMEK